MDDQDLLLSVVATSRNDDHGANLLRRMQTFVNAFIAQCRRHDLPAELILVEWNPPADRPRLAEALRWPADTSPCEVRIIEVPAALHRRLRHSRALPLFQMIAKNVGIRRARGRFVLATNIDILFNDELMRSLKEGRLEAGKMYRIDRTDVETDVPVDAPVEQQLAYCRSHHVRINTEYGTFPLNPDGTRGMAEGDVAGPSSGIILVSGTSAPERDAAGQVFRWGGRDVRMMVTAPADRPRPLLMELSAGPCVRRLPAALEVLREGQVVARGHILGRSLVALNLPVGPGENAVFVIRAVEGGYRLPPPPDSRVLDFAIHNIRWSDEASESTPRTPEEAFTLVTAGTEPHDVVAPAAGVRLDRGWHGLRRVGGVRYRWADSGASLVVGPRAAAVGMRLWVGRGPNLRRGSRTTLRFRDGRGRVLGETDLRRGPHPVSVPPAAGPGAAGPVFLDVLEDGAALSGGGGVQAFRLFSCTMSDAPLGERLGAAGRALAAGVVLRAAAAVKAVVRARRRRALAGPGAAAAGTGSESLPFLHTNACGDFTLMARENWHQLRGYAELEMYSLHIDSLLMYAGHVAGLEEVILPQPMRAYHIEHSAGSGWTPEGESRLFDRLKSKGIPVLTLDDLYEMARGLALRGDPTALCRDDWGLAGEMLPEVRPGCVARAAAA